MERMTKAIESIVKARDENTVINSYIDNIFIYSIMLSHIEHTQYNLYNFKFICRTIDPKAINEIYLNFQVLVNDSSVITNSKYSLSDVNRSSFVASYKFNEKENVNNSYRTDFSISINDSEKDFFIIEIVNNATNTARYIKVSLEMYFKINIFLYNLLNDNIIDGDVFLKKFNNFRRLSDNSQAAYNFCIDSGSKIYKIYWDKRYIIFYVDNSDKHNITYAIFDKDVFENQIYTDNI